MEVTRMKVNRFHGYRGDEPANRALLERLRRHGVTEAHWTDHAITRAKEMVKAGFQFAHMLRAIEKPTQAYWSPTHNQPCGKFGEVSVGLMSDRWGRAIVVTVLPASDEAWKKFYAHGETKGRERRQEPYQHKTAADAPEPLPSDIDDAVALIADAPFKMSFFLYNKDEITELLESDSEAKRVFLASAERVAHSASRRDNRDRLEADINMHPHLSPKEKRHLLMVLHQYGKSITATSAGLPTLGKRR